MRCVLISSSLDLRKLLTPELARLAGSVEVVDHDAGGPNTDIRLAVAWNPPADAFDRYPNLQAVCSIGAGVDSILNCPSLRPGIHVVRVVDPMQAQMMSGFVVCHVIGHQRSFATYRAQQSDRIWRTLPQRGAQSVPVGILGSGVMGQRVAEDLGRLGFPVMTWSRSAKAASTSIRSFHGREGLAAMLAQTEVLVNLLPLTQETRGILNRDLFAAMARGSYLIQVGRGEHHVEEDLLAALKSGQLAGAALDVFAVEPLPPEHPFWRLPNVVVTPHDACDASAAALADTIAATADAIRTDRRPPDAIDRQRGY
jgi:glyoxylate/hydroxypyruvate reductase